VSLQVLKGEKACLAVLVIAFLFAQKNKDR
jgi:hypothetical protein